MFLEQDILNICKLYTIETVSVEFLGVSHNTVYKVNCGSPFILRIVSPNHRSRDELVSEVDFLLFLNSQGANVNRPIASLSKQMIIEQSIQNEKYYIIAFSFVEGVSWRERSDDDCRLEHIGRQLGKIHNISTKYKPYNVMKRRSHSQSQHLTNGLNIFFKYNNSLYNCFIEFLKVLDCLDKNNYNYGLTHGDFLFSNYNITSDNHVEIFDFDECEYSWYLSDIAVCIYYYLLGGNPSELSLKVNEAENSLTLFMTGYLQENSLPLSELNHIDMFFKQRDYILLSTILGQGKNEFTMWEKSFLEGALERTINNKPFVNINIDKIVNRIEKSQHHNMSIIRIKNTR
ncbi:MAG: phosphotransferase [Clostridiaceae bacterium]|nr:phosphotransferase [Clostridiaceae bacterium]